MFMIDPQFQSSVWKVELWGLNWKVTKQKRFNKQFQMSLYERDNESVGS